MAAGYAFERARLSAHVDALAGKGVLLVGDAILDEYLEGDAERISPEAPIPVVTVNRSRLLLGGAGNVARNITSLGGRAHLVSICGTDSKGEILREILRTESVTAAITMTPARTTTVKTRVIARNQQMLRIDHEDASPLSAGETTSILNAVKAAINDYSILVISDYGKGIVSRELMRGIVTLREASASKPLILVDPKTPNYPLYQGAYILTPNAKETGEAAGMPTHSQEEILTAGKAILKNLHARHLLTTLGAQGMALFVSPDEVWHIPTAARKVFDVTGAGDTVMAALALCLAAGVDLLDACILANYAAGLVVADVGTSTVAPAELQSLLAATSKPAISRW